MSTHAGGGGWIRTSVGVSQQIYSLPPLATRAPLLSEPLIMPDFFRVPQLSKIAACNFRHGDHTRAIRHDQTLPRQRGNVSLSNLQVINAILYVAEHGCKWRGLPKRFGNWHTIYTRMNRWTKAGVLDRMFEELQRAQIVRIKIEAVSLDSTSIKVHPDGTGALKKTAHKPSASPEADGTPRFIWLPRMLERP